MRIPWMLMLIFVAACGSFGGMDEEQPGAEETTSYTGISFSGTGYTATETFYCEGGEIVTSGSSDGSLSGEMICLGDGKSHALIMNDDLRYSIIKGLYYLEIHSDSSWSVSVNGSCGAYSDGDDSGDDSDSGHCQGCCSSHGGVVCVDDIITQCADGTQLTELCLEKGCNACY